MRELLTGHWTRQPISVASGQFHVSFLKDAKPADLAVQQATKFEFIINLSAAKQLGLTILPNVLARADRVIR